MPTFDYDERFEASIRVPQMQKNSLIEDAPRKKAIVIAGPTGVGKTALSIHLSKILAAEIVSCDSMQVYQDMDIGTAKPTKEQKQLAQHHLIDVCPIDRTYNVSDFFQDAKKAAESIAARNRIPIFVGGTGFYIDAIIHGPPVGPPADLKIRAELDIEVERRGPEPLYDRLFQLDPDYARSVTPRDRHKIIRGLEIMILSGKKVSDFQPKLHSVGLDFDFHCWFLHMDRNRLYKRIEKRCEQMIEEGLLDEVDSLMEQGLLENHNASKAIGYKQSIAYLQGSRSQDDYQDFVQQFKTATKRYAKKQYTWFRKKEEFRWLDLDKYNFHQLIQLVLRDFDLQ